MKKEFDATTLAIIFLIIFAIAFTIEVIFTNLVGKNPIDLSITILVIFWKDLIITFLLFIITTKIIDKWKQK